MRSVGVLRQVRGSLLTAVLLYVVDVLITGGIVAPLMVVGLVVYMIPVTLFSFRNRALMKQRALEVAIYGAMVVAIVSTVTLNNHIARQRANDLIAACIQYQAKHEKFPDKRDDLVPEFVSKIPAAKPTLSFNRFHYTARPGWHVRMYVVLPPFGRELYIRGRFRVPLPQLGDRVVDLLPPVAARNTRAPDLQA